jgi:hypothetical protein
MSLDMFGDYIEAPVVYPRLVIVTRARYSCYVCAAACDTRVEGARDNTYACCYRCATKVIDIDIPEGALLPTVEEPTHLMKAKLDRFKE